MPRAICHQSDRPSPIARFSSCILYRQFQLQLRLGGTVAIAQAQQSGRQCSDWFAALGHLHQQLPAGRYGPRQVVDAALLMCLALVRNECVDVFGRFDLNLAVTAAMRLRPQAAHDTTQAAAAFWGDSRLTDLATIASCLLLAAPAWLRLIFKLFGPDRVVCTTMPADGSALRMVMVAPMPFISDVCISISVTSGCRWRPASKVAQPWWLRPPLAYPLRA